METQDTTQDTKTKLKAAAEKAAEEKAKTRETEEKAAEELARKREEAESEAQTQRVQQVINGIRDMLNGRKITEALVIRIVANCMLITAKMKIQNPVKKRVVIEALEKYIKEQSDLTQDEIDSLMTIVDIVVSEAIDTIADIKKSKLFACCK